LENEIKPALLLFLCKKGWTLPKSSSGGEMQKHTSLASNDSRANLDKEETVEMNKEYRNCEQSVEGGTKTIN